MFLVERESKNLSYWICLNYDRLLSVCASILCHIQNKFNFVSFGWQQHLQKHPLPKHPPILVTEHFFLLYRDGTHKFSHTVESEPQQSQANQDDISTLGHGVLCCFSNSGKLFALCNPEKELFIWQTSDWKLLSKRSCFIFPS